MSKSSQLSWAKQYKELLDKELLANSKAVLIDLENIIKDEACDHEANVCWCKEHDDAVNLRISLTMSGVDLYA